MKIKGVIFDKDGTLIKFSKLWRLGLEELLEMCQLSENVKAEIKDKVGVNEDLTVRENSIIASGTIGDMAEVFSDYISKTKQEINREITEFFLEYLRNHPEMVVETCDLKTTFESLKKSGIAIGVVTADSYEQSKLSFEMLKLDSYIEFMATGDVYANKPNPQSLDAFCSKFSLDRREVAVVGDSETDMLLGKQAGLSIGVLSGVGTNEMLLKSADIVVQSPSDAAAAITDKYSR